MNILQKSIQYLSKKEIINYKIYTNRIKKDATRKDTLLFDALKKAQNSDLNKNTVFNKIYPTGVDKNVFNKLKGRLLHEIDNSLVQFYFHETDTNYIYSELSLYKIYLAKNANDVAYYHLRNAEKRAVKTQDFVMLDVVYNEYIHLSTYYGHLSPKNYIQKREKNSIRLKELRLLDDTLATIIYDLDRSQTFSKTKLATIAILNRAIKQLSAKKEFKESLVFKSKLFNAASQLFLSKKDYVSLELYSINTYQEFVRENYFSKSNHDIKLQMLRYICNALFINKKYELALEYIHQLKLSMKEYKAMLYDKNVFFYYNSLANNYSILNSEKAIEVLNEAKMIKAIINHPSHLGYIYLNLAGAYFDLENYKIALKNILNLYHHPLFEIVDESLKVQIFIIEIILRIETHHFDYASKLVRAVLNKHKKIINSDEYQQDMGFLTLMKKLIAKFNFENNTLSIKLVNQFCETTYKYKSNNLVDYNRWLQGKFRLGEYITAS